MFVGYDQLEAVLAGVAGSRHPAGCPAEVEFGNLVFPQFGGCGKNAGDDFGRLWPLQRHRGQLAGAVDHLELQRLVAGVALGLDPHPVNLQL